MLRVLVSTEIRDHAAAAMLRFHPGSDYTDGLHHLQNQSGVHSRQMGQRADVDLGDHDNVHRIGRAGMVECQNAGTVNLDLDWQEPTQNLRAVEVISRIGIRGRRSCRHGVLFHVHEPSLLDCPQGLVQSGNIPGRYVVGKLLWGDAPCFGDLLFR